MKRILFLFFLCISTPLVSMKPASYRSKRPKLSLAPEPSKGTPEYLYQPTLLGIPKDIQVYLLSFLVSDDEYTSANTLLNFAETNKYFRALLNDPKNMIIFLKSLHYKYSVTIIANLLKNAYLPGILDHNHGNMPVMQNPEVIAYLLNIRKNDELGSAAFYGDIKKINELLKIPQIDINARDRRGNTVLMRVRMEACCQQPTYQNYKETIKLLLNAGANPNLKNMGGCTALMFAAVEGYKEIVELLLNRGADPYCKDYQGKTTLMYAAEKANNTEIMELLLKAGVNPDLTDNYGKTAADIVIEAKKLHDERANRRFKLC